MINYDRYKLSQYNLQISDNSEKVLLFNTFSGSVCRLETEATLVEYYYDQRGRLIRENNYESNFTAIYSYIADGVQLTTDNNNLYSKKRYSICTPGQDTPTGTVTTLSYTYGNGKTITTLINNGTVSITGESGTIITLNGSGTINCTHKYDEPTYTWADDHSTCTAKRICSYYSGHVETETATITNETITSEITQEKTCTNDELTKYTATFTNSAFAQQVKENVKTADKLNHNYGTPTYTWADDNSTCIAKRVCSNDSSHVETETATATSEVTQNKTCTNDELTKYTATFTNTAFAQQVKENVKTADKLNHSYGEVTYVWADDNSTCTAKRVCSRDENHVETETATATREVTQEKTCTNDELTKYTATFTNTAFTQQVKENVKTADKLNHDYGTPTYTWADDNSTCTAKRVCSNDSSHVETENATITNETITSEITQNKTCTNDELTKYTATFTNTAFTTQIKENVKTADKLNHNYGEVTYVWADDNSTCTAKRVCSREASHVEEESTTITSQVTQNKSCTLDELTKYTATFTNTAFITQTKENVKTADSLGHDMRTVWSKDETHHWHQCSRCDYKIDQDSHIYDGDCDADCNVCKYVRAITHNYSEEWKHDETHHWHECSCGDKNGYTEHWYNQRVQSDEYKATNGSCTEQATYYRSCECGKKGNTTFDGDDYGSHDLGDWVEARPMTCEQFGIIQHRECKICHKCFDVNDNELKNPTISIDDDAHTFGDWEEEVPATCTKEGTVAHKKCIHCSAFFDENGEKIPYEDRYISKNPNNHTGTVNYEWVDKSVHRIVKTCCGTEIELHTGGTATCQQFATCEICGFEYGNKADHSYSTDWSYYDNVYHYKKCEHCEKTGESDRHNIEYVDGRRICSDCGYDATLITSISFNVERPKPGEAPSTATNVVTTPVDVVYIHEWGWTENNSSEDPTVFEDKKQYYFYVVFKANVGYYFGSASPFDGEVIINGGTTEYSTGTIDIYLQTLLICTNYYRAAPEHDHSFGEWEITIPATTDSEGKKERKCSICDVKESEIIPKIDHTCDGEWQNNEDFHWKECGDCNQIFVNQNHAYDDEYDKTCDVCGYERKIYVARYGDTSYETLESAFADAILNASSTIMLLKNATLNSELVIPAEKTMWLMLGNFAISGTGCIKNNGTLYVDNGTASTITNNEGGTLYLNWCEIDTLNNLGKVGLEGRIYDGKYNSTIVTTFNNYSGANATLYKYFDIENLNNYAVVSVAYYAENGNVTTLNNLEGGIVYLDGSITVTMLNNAVNCQANINNESTNVGTIINSGDVYLSSGNLTTVNNKDSGYVYICGGDVTTIDNDAGEVLIDSGNVTTINNKNGGEVETVGGTFGTITNVGSSEAEKICKIRICGGTFEKVESSNKGSLEILGGTFKNLTCNETYLIISGGEFEDYTIANTNPNLYVEITGGTFSKEPSAQYIVEGYECKKNGEVYIVSLHVHVYDNDEDVDCNDCGAVRQFVASINNVKYDSLQKAVDSAQPNEEIVILVDFEIDNVVIVEKEVTIDLNGKQILGKFGKDGMFAMFGVGSGGKLTINDSDEEQKGLLYNGSGTDQVIYVSGGELVINGGTIKAEGEDNALCIFAGIYSDYYTKITINGGKIVSSSNVQCCAIVLVGDYNGEDQLSFTMNDGVIQCSKFAIRSEYLSYLTINDGEISGKFALAIAYGGDVTVKGGTFNGNLGFENSTATISGGTFSVEPSSEFIADGYGCKKDGDVYIVAAHVYDNACDSTCNTCGYERTVGDHVYDNACDTDCNICGYERTVGDHVYDNACDADCNICGYERTVGDHVYDNACDADCNICGYERTVGGHVYDNDDDASCNECGSKRIIVKVTNGTKKENADGSITVTASTAPEGKEFKGWQNAEGKIVSEEVSYTIRESVTLTAIYADKVNGKTDTDKQGLSGGAIAGIAVAGAVVLGLGVFAIIWFVIKKKTLADLIAIFKGKSKKE